MQPLITLSNRLWRQIQWLPQVLYTKKQPTKAERLFYERAKTAKPPQISDYPLKTKKYSFNHENQYAIHQGILWFKPLNGDKIDWQPIFFEGFASNIVPEEVQADGANLIVKAKGEIYDKKVLEEKRDHLRYTCKDISQQNNWHPTWFRLPVIKYLHNAFYDNRLKLPPDCRGFAISHRGRFCGQVEDALGVVHHNPFTITSFYVLEKDGRFLILFDPYVNIYAHFIIPLPATSRSYFEAIFIAASASTVLIIGYEIEPLVGGGIRKTLKVITLFIDHDLLGNHPAIKTDYKVNAPKPQAFMLPMPGYMEHPLELKGAAAIVKDDATIFQTGPGNQAREMRIFGWNENKEPGYYRKKISDDAWSFIPFQHEHSYVEALPTYSEDPKQQFKTTVRDYVGGTLKSAHLPAGTSCSLSLRQFDKTHFNTTLELKINGMTYDLLIHKSHTVLNFIFPSLSPRYQLVLPPLQEMPAEKQRIIKSLFNNVTLISIFEDKGFLKITPQFLTGMKFEIAFEQ